MIGKPAGPWLAPALEQLLQWQLQYPEKTVEEAKEFLKLLIIE
jgi:hypothetical protein